MEKNKYHFLEDDDRTNDLDEIDLSEFDFNDAAVETPEDSANEGGNEVKPGKGPVKKSKPKVIKRKGVKDMRRVEIRVPFDIYMALSILAKVGNKSLTEYICEVIDKELCNEKEKLHSVMKLIR